MANDYYFFNRGLRLHCERAGDPASANLVVFLHGLASNATRWRELMQHSQLKGLACLIAMNLRGHDRSMSFRAYTRQDWCDDLHELCMRLPHPTILAGHSMGAQIALQYAAEHHASLRSLILIDPVFPQALDGVLKKVARLRRLVSLIAMLLRGLARLGLRKRHYALRDMQRLDEQTRAFLAENPDKGIADLYMNPFSDLKFMPVANYLQDLVEVTRPLPSLASIDIPVLVLLSAGASTSQVEVNKRLLAELPRCEIREIDADHWLLTERPREAREIIDQWCIEQFTTRR